ncbi:MAG: hypothetical protein AAF153_01980 [Pseudomonadota bacterium]
MRLHLKKLLFFALVIGAVVFGSAKQQIITSYYHHFFTKFKYEQPEQQLVVHLDASNSMFPALLNVIKAAFSEYDVVIDNDQQQRYIQ